MLVKYTLRLGSDEFELNVDVKDEKEFFEKLSFYSSLPKAAPGGATDLKITFRMTKEGYKYYSLVSESEKLEYRFGQAKDAEGGALFSKGWTALYEGNENEQSANKPAPAFGSQQAARPAAQATTQAAPAFGSQAMPTPQAAPVPQTVAAPVQQAAPQVNSAAANNVLSRFGINKQ